MVYWPIGHTFTLHSIHNEEQKQAAEWLETLLFTFSLETLLYTLLIPYYH